MPRQLAFDLPVRPALGREDFMVAPSNALAVAALENWRGWRDGKLLLVGPKGCGKTHLAGVWAGMSGARIVPAAALEIPDAPELAEAGAVVVEDADAPRLNERALLHLHNLLQAQGGALLVTARQGPASWGLALADLASRMEGAGLARIDPPDDTLLRAVLIKNFADRQLAVPTDVLAFVMARMERSFAAAQDIARQLDEAALVEKRKVSKALAARILDNPGTGEA